MPELRHDPIQRRWVIIATDRARRPSDFIIEEPVSEMALCPFCEGNEDKTPPEIYAVRKPGGGPNTPGWSVRVIPNKFPALEIEGDLDRRGLGIFDAMNGVGAHEIIIETPHHHLDLAEMPVEDVELVLLACQERLRDLRQDKRLRYVLFFKNHGMRAGASLSHPHTQLIATPITPLNVSTELESSRIHYFTKERCLFCDIIAQELGQGERIVHVNEDYVVLTPFASRFPFETLITPVKHQHDFILATRQQITNLARTLRSTLSRLKASLKDPPYNFVLHTAPNTGTVSPRRPGYWETLEYDFHWHIEIIPRLTRVAGFEWGTGFYINPTPPEDAAEYLRNVDFT